MNSEKLQMKALSYRQKVNDAEHELWDAIKEAVMERGGEIKMFDVKKIATEQYDHDELIEIENLEPDNDYPDDFYYLYGLKFARNGEIRLLVTDTGKPIKTLQLMNQMVKYNLMDIATTLANVLDEMEYSDAIDMEFVPDIAKVLADLPAGHYGANTHIYNMWMNLEGYQQEYARRYLESRNMKVTVTAHGLALVQKDTKVTKKRK